VICPKCGRPRATEEDEGVHNTGECGCPSARALCWRAYCGQCDSVFDPLNIGDYLKGFCQPSGYECRHCGRAVEAWNVRHDPDGQFSCANGCDSWRPTERHAPFSNDATSGSPSLIRCSRPSM
jgi:hypothetical protein